MRGDDISSPRTLKEFRFLPGAREVVIAAREVGFFTVLATNQPDVTLGRMTRETLEAILEQIKSLGLDDIEVCEDGTFTDRRCKPNPGMLIDAAAKHNLDLSKSYFVGDHGRDVEAGQRAGVKTILLRASYNRSHGGVADHEFDTLQQVAQFLRARRQ